MLVYGRLLWRKKSHRQGFCHYKGQGRFCHHTEVVQESDYRWECLVYWLGDTAAKDGRPPRRRPVTHADATLAALPPPR